MTWIKDGDWILNNTCTSLPHWWLASFSLSSDEEQYLNNWLIYLDIWNVNSSPGIQTSVVFSPCSVPYIMSLMPITIFLVVFLSGCYIMQVSNRQAQVILTFNASLVDILNHCCSVTLSTGTLIYLRWIQVVFNFNFSIKKIKQ